MILDIEVATAPAEDGLAIVTVQEMKKHLKITQTGWDDDIESAIVDAGAHFHGTTGILNRTLFPMQWRLHRPAFPTSRIIRLPFPPLRSVDSIAYMSGAASPNPLLSAANYIVRTGDGSQVGEIELLTTEDWPNTDDHPRGVEIVFSAGYEDYPSQLKRIIKLYAAHLLENREATMIDQMRGAQVSRKTEFGLDYLVNALAVPVDMGNWDTDRDP